MGGLCGATYCGIGTYHQYCASQHIHCALQHTRQSI